MTADQVSTVSGPADIPQFNWRQLAGFLLLPLAWWFVLLYGITPLVLPAFTAPNGELNGYALTSIATLGYLFEFLLALRIFRQEGYPLRWRALKGRIHWRWPRGWKAWLIVLAVFVVGFGVSQLLQPTKQAIAGVVPPPDWFPASKHPFKEANSLQDNYPGVVFEGNYLFLLLALFNGAINIVGEELYYRGALIPKLHGLFGKWAWLAGGILFVLKHSYVWWELAAEAVPIGLVGAYIFGPLGSLPVAMLIHFIPGVGLSWPVLFRALLRGS
jgi:membrane protease YdiL (CAAX protease family)